jgi:hypothetical protein
VNYDGEQDERLKFTHFKGLAAKSANKLGSPYFSMVAGPGHLMSPGESQQIYFVHDIREGYCLPLFLVLVIDRLRYIMEFREIR